MRASASSILALLPFVIASGLSGSVEAQTLTFTVSQIGTRDITGTGTAYVSAAECSGNIEIKASTTGQFDIWRGAEGSNCQTASNRSSTTNTTCTFVTHISSLDENLVFSVPMTTMTTGTTACTATDAASQGQTFEYALIQTTTSMDTSTSSPYGSVALRVDAASPVAVTIDEEDRHRLGGSVSLQFDPVTGEQEQISYYAYIDRTGTCAEDGTPSSSVLVPGSAPPSDGTHVNASNSISASSAGVSVGDNVVVAIASVDIAGNIGKLSELVCISFVETVGFCSGEDPECHENCAVSTPGARGPLPVLLLSALASLALVVHARRRRSAK